MGTHTLMEPALLIKNTVSVYGGLTGVRPLLSASCPSCHRNLSYEIGALFPPFTQTH